MHQKKSFAGGSAWRDPAFLGLGFIVVITAAYLAGGFTILESIGLNSVVKGQIENSLKLALACVMGSMIGLERGNKNRPAGIRTNALVCTGSTLIMIISFDLFFKYNHLANFDPARLGAQVISGIGFLGAGTIIRNGTTVKGLTTAASLWVVASLGLAIGAGMYVEAVLAFTMVYFTLHQLGNMEQRQMLKKANVEFAIITKDRAGQIGEIGQAFGRRGVRITNLSLEREDDAFEEDTVQDDSEICVMLSTKLPMGMSGEDLKSDLDHIDGVVSVAFKNLGALS